MHYADPLLNPTIPLSPNTWTIDAIPRQPAPVGQITDTLRIDAATRRVHVERTLAGVSTSTLGLE